MAAGLVAATVPACGEAPEDDVVAQGTSANAAADEGTTRLVWDSLPGENVRFIAPYQSFGDAAPNSEFVFSDGTRRAMSNMLAVGEVTGAEPVGGLSTPDSPDDEPIDRRVPADDQRADFVVFEVSIAVEVAYDESGRVDDISREQFYLALLLNAPVEALTSGLEALGRVAVPLYSGTALIADDPAAFGVVEAGRLMATVDSGGNLSLPGQISSREASLLEATPDLSSLDTQATSGRREIPA